MEEKKTQHNTYVLYPGRFQSPHIGHMAIFEESLKQGKKVCIAIRDTEIDEQNPLSAEQVKFLWEKIYAENENVKAIIIPDIEAIRYGRKVGYSVEEIIVTSEVANISATQIRNQIKEGNSEWKKYVDEKIHSDIESYLTK